MAQAETIQVQMTDSKANSITVIVNDYRRRLLGFIRKRVTNGADAEDILQDVFYQLLGNKEPIDQVASWLFTVARNKIIDSKRKKQPLSTDFLFSNTEDDEMGEWMNILLDDSSNPETVYLRNLFRETLKEALNELPEDQKQAFVLNELDGIPFKQISDETRIPINTLISRKRYAVLYLREKLAVLHDALKNY
ncbi:MAG TPA: sigma-70 family RNA polymerase sigma factor [Puia sp.]|jgi:RNA polymerase sigma factor (sigma-70 family)|nr:sigma-70 family RNA polymerase sigma factor [Puia sp.]